MYRLLEIFPGALAWGTIAFLVASSRFFPQAVGIFVVLFDVYWLLKSIYLSIHMRATFRMMKANLKVDWLARLKEFDSDDGDDNNGKSYRHDNSHSSNWHAIRHLIIFPMYREPYAVIRESFASLARAEYPKDRFLVVLATEAAAGEEAEEAARRIKEEFGGCFGGFLVSVHPRGLPGEVPGKGSNIAWAAREAQREFGIGEARAVEAGESVMSHELPVISAENVLVSAFDIDTQTPPGYFARLTHVFLSVPDPLHAIYQPIPLFTNNIYETPLLARIVAFSATFWQMMQQARPERLTTFSSQSVPLPVLLDVGFWHRDVVSEDSRIFWQAYLRYRGNFRVEPLTFPVMMDANVAPTFFGTLRNIYLQQRRWGWGVENVPYVLNGFFSRSKAVQPPNTEQIPLRKKLYWTFHLVEGFHSWATNVLILFFLGWMPTLIGGERFHATLFSYNIPGVTRALMIVAMFGVITAAEVGLALLPPRPSWFRRRHALVYVLEWFLLPLTLIFFGAFPGLEAQTRLMLGGRWRLGFWVTPKGRSGVGRKREGSPA